MKKTTPDGPEPREKIYPPGEELKSKLPKKPVGKIHFPERRERTLLSPLVEAYHTEDNRLLVRAVVFIASKDLKNIDFSIYQNVYIGLDTKPKFQFFISYDLLESEEKEYHIFELDFYAKEVPFITDFTEIDIIETFLWDIDPVASRGTVTNVGSAIP